MVKKIFLAICLASFVAQVSALDRSEEKNSGNFISMRELD